jgi:hypothetical protein
MFEGIFRPFHLIVILVVLLAGAALVAYLIWRVAAGKPRDGSHGGRTPAP